VLEQSAKAFAAKDRAVRGQRCGCGNRNGAETLVRALQVIMLKVFFGQIAKVIFAENDEMVEALGLDAQDEALGVGVKIGSRWADFDHFDAFGFEDSVESGGERGIAIVNQMRRLGGVTFGLEQEVAGFLRDPGAVGMRSHAGDNDPARADMDEEEHVVIHQAAKGPDFLGEEVASPQGGNMLLDELLPGRFAAFGIGIESGFAKDLRDRGWTDVGDGQFLEFVVDALVAPGVFTCQAQDEFTDFALGLGSARRTLG